MRIALACAATLVIAAPALADWEVMGPYTQIDPASVQPDESGFTIGVRHFDLDKGGLPPPLKSTVAHVHFDCHAHVSQQLDVAYYDGQDRLIGGGKAPKDDRPVNDSGGTLAAIEARFCPHAKAH